MVVDFNNAVRGDRVELIHDRVSHSCTLLKVDIVNREVTVDLLDYNLRHKRNLIISFDLITLWDKPKVGEEMVEIILKSLRTKTN